MSEERGGAPADTQEHRDRAEAALVRGGWLGKPPRRWRRGPRQLSFRDNLAPGGAAEVKQG